ncbi:MAG: hypothetical protein LBC96_02735 [Lachnospiraceae bacterium]|jgi:hypothetical protein|nr:hypothetical protein [Lachnospiraceae bacterium]
MREYGSTNDISSDTKPDSRSDSRVDSELSSDVGMDLNTQDSKVLLEKGSKDIMAGSLAGIAAITGPFAPYHEWSQPESILGPSTEQVHVMTDEENERLRPRSPQEILAEMGATISEGETAPEFEELVGEDYNAHEDESLPDEAEDYQEEPESLPDSEPEAITDDSELPEAEPMFEEPELVTDDFSPVEEASEPILDTPEPIIDDFSPIPDTSDSIAAEPEIIDDVPDYDAAGDID